MKHCRTDRRGPNGSQISGTKSVKNVVYKTRPHNINQLRSINTVITSWETEERPQNFPAPRKHFQLKISNELPVKIINIKLRNS